ncbi:hypothetical protein [Aliikangiella sp. IMCC44359]|uniref:hypothetical protein n=1 Tax=Aliikangiella sp. IMCC44359 TaxID=3459125 RepID=UPI00403AA4EA
MSYQIEAYLNNGKPSLKIYDLKRKSLCLSWTYSNTPDECQSQQEVQRLFRELLLLTCKQDMHNVRVFNLSPRQPDNKISQTILLS